MVLLPSSAAATAKAKAWVAQQLQTDSYTTNQSTGSRAARLSEIEKLAIDVADLEKQVAQARKRADYARRARAGTEQRGGGRRGSSKPARSSGGRAWASGACPQSAC